MKRIFRLINLAEIGTEENALLCDYSLALIQPSPTFSIVKTNTLKNKSGRLTAYALACGYVELFEKGPHRLTLWREHGTLHVRHFNHESMERIFWECPETLTSARALFNRAKRLIQSI